MPTEAERIEVLEREVADLRTKVQAIEADIAPIPGLITTGFRQVDSRFARVHAEMADLRRHVDERFTNLEAHMDERFDATISAVAEIIRDSKSS